MTVAKRIIPCLDVKAGQVVKGVRFQGHEVVGNVIERAEFYSKAGADELVFYDISASCEGRQVGCEWIKLVAEKINIPFCVAGGIRSVKGARAALATGADKVSINSPALENPQLIGELAAEFGQQCVVIGIDSYHDQGEYWVYQYTGDESRSQRTTIKTLDWVQEVTALGAGEIVLNCMNQDGVRKGYDLKQLKKVRQVTALPLIASGGAGELQHFSEVFKEINVDGALAASVFHKNDINLDELKHYLKQQGITVRV